MNMHLSNSLPDLAARIRAEHEATGTALKRGVEHAMAAGDLLIEGKAQLKHGQWLPWLTEHCAMSERTAQLYMRLAKNRATIEANTQPIADLTMNKAVVLLQPAESFADVIGEIGVILDEVRVSFDQAYEIHDARTATAFTPCFDRAMDQFEDVAKLFQRVPKERGGDEMLQIPSLADRHFEMVVESYFISYRCLGFLTDEADETDRREFGVSRIRRWKKLRQPEKFRATVKMKIKRCKAAIEGEG